MFIAAFSALALSAGQPPAMERIAVRQGRFVGATTGAAFHPRGMNYIRIRTLHKDGATALWHDTFNPASYSGTRAEAMFADLAASGYNVVRVFIDQEPGAGMVRAAGDSELSAAYVGTMADFLRRARSHGVRVILCFCYLPDRRQYTEMLKGCPPEVAGENQAYLNPGFVRAKAAWIADTARALKEIDPGLLTAVFAYELENESHFMATKPPFSLSEGALKFGGRTYDLAKMEDQERLADDGIVAAIDAAVAAVRKVDPGALVGASVFTFNAVGRTGPARHRTDRTADPRFPARPLALARSRAAYVDVHFYPMGPASLDKDFASIEMEDLLADCRKRGKPMIVGEVGAFKHVYATLPAASAAMRTEIARLLGAGFAGYLFWAYDTEEQNDLLWNATSGDGSMLRSLPPVP